VSIIDLVQGPLTPAAVVEILEQLAERHELSEAVRGSDIGKALSRSLEIDRRRVGLDSLRAIVENPASTEHDIHRELKQQLWIFGGRYFDVASRRQLTTQTSLDIPLIRGDGALHVIELKQASIQNLIENYRSWQVVGSEVNRGVGQLQNYLRDLDEHRAAILADHGVDTRRAGGALLIGDTRNAGPFTPAQVAETLRTYNSHLSRIEVLTYDQLLDNAERLLDFDTEPPESEPTAAT
jgi:hypothetical protein